MSRSIIHKYYDEHTLYVDSGAISQKKLETILNHAILPLQNKMTEVGIKLNTKHELKLVVNKEGINLGRAYLWVEDPQLYHILNGRNPDGSERIEEYQDPDWVPREGPADFTIPEGTNWGDLDEDEDEPPIIRVKKPSLVQFDTYIYSEEEKKLTRKIVELELKNNALNEFYEKVVIQNYPQEWKNSATEFYKLLGSIKSSYNVEENIITQAIIKVLSSEIKIDPTDPSEEQTTLNEDFIEQIVASLNSIADPIVPNNHIISISGAYVLNVETDQLKNVLTAKVYPVILDEKNPIHRKIINKKNL